MKKSGEKEKTSLITLPPKEERGTTGDQYGEVGEKASFRQVQVYDLTGERRGKS